LKQAMLCHIVCSLHTFIHKHAACLPTQSFLDQFQFYLFSIILIKLLIHQRKTTNLQSHKPQPTSLCQHLFCECCLRVSEIWTMYTYIIHMVYVEVWRCRYYFRQN
jgi:hypothetical protein